MSEESIFNKALHNFINDFASGDAIRHLADKGLTVSDITKRLDYPTPKKKVAQIVWQHFLDSGTISLDKPSDSGEHIRYTYVTDHGKYGTTSLRRVSEVVKSAPKEYIACDYGIKLYQNRELFISHLTGLSVKDQEYILDLPWPPQIVYHESDERITRINQYLLERNRSETNA